MVPREQSGEQPNYGTDGRGASLSDTSFTRREPLLNVPSSTAGLTNASTTELPKPALHTALDIAALSGRKPAIVASVTVLLYLIFGIVAFHYLLNLTWASAFYFAVTTSLTVGYGDIDAWSAMDNSTSADDGRPYTPNDGAIVFTTLYIIGGMVVMGTSLGLLLQAILDAPSSRDDVSFSKQYPLVISGLACVVVIGLGASLLSTTEHEDAVHGIYWAVVTISTVGYGSGHPTSDEGRVATAFYMLIGVACMGKFVGDLAERPLRAHRRRLEEKVIHQYGGSLDEGELWELAASEEFRRLDLRRAEGAGVSRDAFCLMMLVRTEKLDAGDLKRCQGAFDALDADGSGELDMADVQAAREAAAGAGAGGSA